MWHCYIEEEMWQVILEVEEHTIQWLQIMTDMKTNVVPYDKELQALFINHESTLDKIIPKIPGTMCMTDRIIKLQPTLVDQI